MKERRPREQKEVMELVKQHGVKFIRLWFTDIHGIMKGFTIPVEQLEGAFSEGMGFDGSSIHGFARMDESDMVARPDPSTFQLLPWRPSEQSVARMFCDIHEPDGSPYPGDPRHVLRQATARAKKLGYTFYVGPEMEHFYFKGSDATQTLDSSGYFDLQSDATEEARRDTILSLEAMGIHVEYIHHEAAHSQYEVDLRYQDAMQMADTVMTYRMVVKEIARRHGIYATFMPKPIFGQNGSGMHTHMSLFRDGENAFFDPNDRHYLSDTAKRFTAGILQHVREITIVLNQWVNSYKRLVPGYESPVYVCWAMRNRSSLVRVPLHKPGKENSTRIELRSPDPACNPYLAFAAMLEVGLDGIEHDYELPAPTETDVYHLSEEERIKMGLQKLPGSLVEAIEIAQESEMLRRILGPQVFRELIMSKKTEWTQYSARVFPYEIETYLPML